MLRRMRFNNLKFELGQDPGLNDKFKQLRSSFKGILDKDILQETDTVEKLFDELEEKGVVHIYKTAAFKELLGIVERPDLLKKVVEFERQRDEQTGLLQDYVYTLTVKGKQLKRGTGSLLRAVAGVVDLNLKITFKVGAVVVAGVTVFHVITKCPDFFARFSEYALPIGMDLIDMGNGCLCLTVQTKDLSALRALWGSYQKRTLKKRLQEFLLTEKITQLAKSQEVEVDVFISEQEYKDACLDLMAAKVQDQEIQEEEHQTGLKRRWCSESDVSAYEAKAKETSSLLLGSIQPLVEEMEKQKMSVQEKENENLSAKLMEARSVVAAGPSVEQSKEIVSEMQNVPLTLKRKRSSDSTLYGQSKESKLDVQQATEEQKVQTMGELDMGKVTKKVEDCHGEMMAAVKKLSDDLKEHTATMMFELREIYEVLQKLAGKEKGMETAESSGKKAKFTEEAKILVQVSQDLHRYQEVLTFGSRGKGQGQFEGPDHIAVSEKTGNIAVADDGNKIIQIFSSEGQFVREFGLQGPGFPHTVAFTRSGDLIVSHGRHTKGDRISVFDETGQCTKHITNEHLKDPVRVSVGHDDRLIVCNNGDKTVKVLSPDGTELFQSFSAPDCDKSPSFAVNHEELFFVTYCTAHCVKVFDKNGVFLYDIGSKGSGDGQLYDPRGLVVDKFNNLIVVDSGNFRLQVFTIDGTFVTKLEGQLTELKSPKSVAVSQDGRLFVTDGNKHCVVVFQ